MKFRRLEIKVKTADGPYQTAIDFPDGLVVVWADNTRGKSMCVKAIISALGLESMLTTDQKALPLPPALTDSLKNEDGKNVAVLESDLYLEMENSNGVIITLHRIVKSSAKSKISNIVTVYNGPLLTSPGLHCQSRDYFANQKGSARGNVGFHRFLEDFLGWNLPKVPQYNGEECILYLQCIFPYFVVEQTKGWSSVQPVGPKQFQIKDSSVRTAEFILDLDITKKILKKQKLLQEQERIKNGWASIISALRLIAKEHAAILIGIPDSPIVSWPPDVPYSICMDIENKIIPLKQHLLELKKEFNKLKNHDIPKTNEVIDSVEKELAATDYQLRQSELFLRQLQEEHAIKNDACNMIKKRIVALQVDLQRNKDLQTLLKLGGKDYESIGAHQCPTCKQAIPDSLVPDPVNHPIMSLDENVVFLDEQRRTYEGLLKQAQNEEERANALVRAQERIVNGTRSRIRSLKSTLVQDGHSPSIEAIQKQIRLENGIIELDQLTELFENEVSSLEPLSNEWHEFTVEFNKYKDVTSSNDDENKIRSWISEFRNGLRAFGFTSLDIDKIELSEDTFRPEFEESEYSVSNTCSASDTIRMIWAYLMGLLVVARSQHINHPGFLIFDEPRQQNTKVPSFSGLTLESAKTRKHQQQVIIFTSEDKSVLNEKLNEIPKRFTIKRLPVSIPVRKAYTGKKKRGFRFHRQCVRLIVMKKNYSLQSFEDYIITKAVSTDAE